jgi:hypothetical protein
MAEVLERDRPIGKPADGPGGHSIPRMSRKKQFVIVLCATIVLSSAVDHLIAAWIKVRRPVTTYRRIGPESGPQTFMAGSSLLQFALDWEEVSRAVGRGIENWGIPGSSPREWEVFQERATNSNLMIISADLHGLNEYQVCDIHANIVPLKTTVLDVLNARSHRSLSMRLIGDYPLAYLRKLFPTAGRSVEVMVAARRKARELMGKRQVNSNQGDFLVLPDQPILNFGNETNKLSDWSAAKMLRRMASIRTQIRGKIAFHGSKQLAFRRMLTNAAGQGPVIVVVLPVSKSYAREFVTPEVQREFESGLREVAAGLPEIQVVRLDQVEELSSDENYADPVHLNGAGRRIATDTFLTWLKEHPIKSGPTVSASANN